MNTIPLPERAYTCLPPWPQAMAFADKRLENRGYGVARQIGDWRGLIAVSQSKTLSLEAEFNLAQTLDDWRHSGIAPWYPAACKNYSAREPALPNQAEWAGTIPIVAELVEVLAPHFSAGDPWHVPGQWGLILGRLWLVEPVPCTGGVGAWTVEWCAFCGHVYADCSRHPERCYTCKRKCAIAAWSQARPELNVIKECVV